MTQSVETSNLRKTLLDPTPRVIALIPAFNEERFIASVVLATKPYVHEVVVIDDGSSDRTAQRAQAAGATIIRQPHNLGKAEALNAGFRYARSTPPDAVVCLDGDAQHDPADIPEMVAPVLQGEADVVIGSRFLSKKSDIPGWRIVGQHSLTAITNFTSGIRTTDSQSGFRAFAPVAVEALYFNSAGLGLESEMQFRIGEANLRVAEVPIRVAYKDGNKRNPIVQGMQIVDYVIGLVARQRPLVFFSVPGTVIGMIGVLIGINVFWQLNLTGVLPTASALLASVLIMGGLLLAVTGVLLSSLGVFVERIREEFEEIIQKKLEERL